MMPLLPARSRHRRGIATAAVIGIACALLPISALNAAAKNATPSSLPEAEFRRISAEQYRNIIHDVFGPTVELGGRFEPELRLNGLLAVGASSIAATAVGMEQFDAIARSIASQVVNQKHREQMIPCQPAAVTAPDDACARRFLGKVGRLLYRQPLPGRQLDAHVGAAHVGAEGVKDFYRGLALSLGAMLSSPQFLFRKATLEPDPEQRGGYRLDAHAKASQLSFFLWNAGPDLLLLKAAESGELNSRKGLARQVDRMIASPRLEAGVRAFFVDNFRFDDTVSITKDVALFPKYNAQVIANAREQTLRTIVDLLLKQKGDYRDLFTTKKTFLTRELGAIYRVPVVGTQPNGSPDTWEPFEFPPNDPRGGILTQVAFTATHSPAGRGSPTLRGKALREIILCQKVPAPPGDVDFTLVNNTTSYNTARERLAAHATEPMCAGCHKIMDPIGLALENFDGAGEYRTTENGAPIDASGELNGVKFSDPSGLGRAVHDDPAAATCLVNRLSAYALGRVPANAKQPWVALLQKSFATNGYRVPELMRTIATSDAFYRVAPKGEPSPPKQKAAATTLPQPEIRK